MYCCTPKALYNHMRGSLLKHHQCAASTWMMRRQPQHNGASALTTHQLQVERRERSSQSSGWGLLGGHDWQGPVEGIWPGHRGYTPTLYEKCHGIFNDHRESGPRFNVSSERRCSFDSIVSPSLYWVGPTQTTGWAPPAGLTNTSSNSNLVFPGGLPSRYRPGSTLLIFSGQPVLGCRVIWLWQYVPSFRLFTICFSAQ